KPSASAPNASPRGFASWGNNSTEGPSYWKLVQVLSPDESDRIRVAPYYSFKPRMIPSRCKFIMCPIATNPSKMETARPINSTTSQGNDATLPAETIWLLLASSSVGGCGEAGATTSCPRPLDATVWVSSCKKKRMRSLSVMVTWFVALAESSSSHGDGVSSAAAHAGFSRVNPSSQTAVLKDS